MDLMIVRRVEAGHWSESYIYYQQCNVNYNQQQFFQMLHFSPALYNHVVHELGKHAILVLNKVDMVAPELVVAWKSYFLSQFPKLYITCFTSYPKEAVTNRTPGKGKKNSTNMSWTVSLSRPPIWLNSHLFTCSHILIHFVCCGIWGARKPHYGAHAGDLI